jgi:hypothetical protein
MGVYAKKQPQRRATCKKRIHIKRNARSVFCTYGFNGLWQKRNGGAGSRSKAQDGDSVHNVLCIMKNKVNPLVIAHYTGIIQPELFNFDKTVYAI